MMIKPNMAVAVALLLVAAGGAQAAPKHKAGCDRACLHNAMTAYLDAMVAHKTHAPILSKDIRRQTIPACSSTKSTRSWNCERVGEGWVLMFLQLGRAVQGGPAVKTPFSLR